MVGALTDEATGIWVGTTHGRLQRASKMLTAGYATEGDFWFRVDEDGNVRGHAVVSYTPSSDVTGINGAVTLAKTAESSALSILPGGAWAAVAQGINNTGTAAILGVKVSYPDPLPVSQGPIVGMLKDRNLSLRWAEPRTTDIAFKYSLSFVTGQQDLVTERLAPGPPWPGAAGVVGGDGGWQAIGVKKTSATKNGVSSSSASYWSAHRVSR
jgi:hypothetical protein